MFTTEQPSSPNDAQLRRAKKSRAQQVDGFATAEDDFCFQQKSHIPGTEDPSVFCQDEQPSSPMADQLRRTKRVAQCSNSGNTTSRSLQQQACELQEGVQQEGGLTQAQLDSLCESYALPSEEESWQDDQPSSPQDQMLLRQRRQNAVASSALGGAVMPSPVGISQEELDSLSMSCPASPASGNGVAESSQPHQDEQQAEAERQREGEEERKREEERVRLERERTQKEEAEAKKQVEADTKQQSSGQTAHELAQKQGKKASADVRSLLSSPTPVRRIAGA